MKRTSWFPRHIKPVRAGHYEVRLVVSWSLSPIIVLWHWDGKVWSDEGTIVPMLSCDQWRGLTSPSEN